MDKNEKAPFIFRLNRGYEIEVFSEKHKDFLLLLPELGVAIDKVFSQIAPKGNKEVVVWMLGRLCVRHFEAVMLLCTHGYGFRAMATLRSMFEKAVDSFYLNKNPSEVENLIDYGLLQLKRTGYEAIARKREPDLDLKIARFKKGKGGGWESSWSKKNLVRRAEAVGVSKDDINTYYRSANEFVHSSSGELELSMQRAADGSLDAVESDNEAERKFAFVCTHLSCSLVIQVLRNQIACFDLPECEELENFTDKLKNYFPDGK